MATDTGIVTIYDMKNGGAPFKCHRIDAREALGHPSGRWSASPEGKKKTVGDAEPLDVGGDSGKAMKLKAETNKALVVMCQKEGIPDLRQSGLKKVMDGITSLEEINRVTKD